MTDNFIKILINDKDLGKRIDIVLSIKIPSLSRSRLQRLLSEKKVKFNNKIITEHSYKFKECGHAEINIPPILKLNIKSQNIKLNIVFEDDDLIVVNKPAGMVVHPGPGNKDNTLVNALLCYCKDSLSGIGGYERPGIVHRIDKMTSGLVIIAKNDFTHKALSDQFKNREIEKMYEAFVWNKIKIKSQKIIGKISRSKTNRKKMAIDENNGKNAITIFTKLDEFIISDKLIINRVRCQILTGRTHQIRVHLSSIGNPILGDNIYGRNRVDLFSKNISTELRSCLDKTYQDQRHTLHAGSIKFFHPKKRKIMKLCVELPEDMSKLLAELKLNKI